MVEKRFTKEYPPFRDEFGCVNNLINGDSYICGNSSFIGERDAIDTAIEVCKVFNEMYFENEQLNEENRKLRELLYDSESIVIGEFSSHIKQDMEKLNEVINGPIEDLEKFIKI